MLRVAIGTQWANNIKDKLNNIKNDFYNYGPVTLAYLGTLIMLQIIQALNFPLFLRGHQ